MSDLKSHTAAPAAQCIEPMEPQRDEWGSWEHPDYIPDLEEGALRVEFDVWLEVNGVECFARLMEDDLEPGSPEAIAWESLDCGCSAWNPQPPEGESWFLVSVHDTENGPSAVWLRKLPDAQPTTPYDALLRFYRKLHDEHGTLDGEVQRLRYRCDNLKRKYDELKEIRLKEVHGQPTIEAWQHKGQPRKIILDCDIEQWRKTSGCWNALFSAPVAPTVALNFHRGDALCDLSYAHGMLTGWNFAQDNDSEGIDKAISDRTVSAVAALRELFTSQNARLAFEDALSEAGYPRPERDQNQDGDYLDRRDQDRFVGWQLAMAQITDTPLTTDALLPADAAPAEHSAAVRYMNKYTGRCYTLEQQPGADVDTAVYEPLYRGPQAPVESAVVPVPDERARLRRVAQDYQSTLSWYQENLNSLNAEQDCDEATAAFEREISHREMDIIADLLDEIDELQESKAATPPAASRVPDGANTVIQSVGMESLEKYASGWFKNEHIATGDVQAMAEYFVNLSRAAPSPSEEGE